MVPKALRSSVLLLDVLGQRRWGGRAPGPGGGSRLSRAGHHPVQAQLESVLAITEIYSHTLATSPLVIPTFSSHHPGQV